MSQEPTSKEQEALPPLPKGWEWTTLGEVCRSPQYGWTTKAITDGEIPLLRTTDISSGSVEWDSVPFCKERPEDIEKYLLENGDIVVSRAGSVGVSYLIRQPPRAVFASYLIRFKPLIDSAYVAFFMNTSFYWNSISERKLGITVLNVNASKLKTISFPLAPLSEQHRIVAKIEELFTKLDAGVESLKRARALLKPIFYSCKFEVAF